MSRSLALILLAAAVLPCPPVAARTGAGPLTQITGTWTVTRVAAPDGVAALVPDDPSYKGRRLAFSAARLAWIGGAQRNQASTGWSCLGPVLTAVPSVEAVPDPDGARQLRALGALRAPAYRVTCKSGTWNPDGTYLRIVARDAIVLDWYDGGVLKLVRSR